ncbi:hypothetical protein Ahy_B04g072760 [Arachis hypogaea]|uniref:BED-type domain-containing protein n=1 Tax=Arachis hypogaea TaxID=3818 RepID=A0A444ZNW4_ARAHY|nr:hypothetical protein Ahy_B04g072760 [Arachis hypogaea]
MVKFFNKLIKIYFSLMMVLVLWRHQLIILMMTRYIFLKACIGMSASTQPSSPPSENATEMKAKCKYCGSLIQYWNRTSSMGGHLRTCKKNPNNDLNKRRKTTTTPTR